MTVPSGSYPNGTLTQDLSPLNGLDEASWKANLRANKLSGFDAAHAIFSGKRQQYLSQLADMQDGQLGLNDRTDLLAEISGYGCAVMGRNWVVPADSPAVVVPFDRQVGPAKHVASVSEDMYHGRLCLKQGGLWRVDAMMTMEYRSYTSVWINVALTQYYDKTVVPVYTLEVVDAAGNLFSAKTFQGTAPYTNAVTYNQAPPLRRQSGAFSHTFVLPEMLPDDDPAAPGQWFYVRLSAKWSKGGGVTSSGKFIGGTASSGLYASRWSLDADHINYADTVPDGGTLS